MSKQGRLKELLTFHGAQIIVNKKAWKLPVVLEDGYTKKILDYAPWNGNYDGVENFIFEGRLKPLGMSRGRSAASVHFDCGGVILTMKLSKTFELLEALSKGKLTISHGAFRGKWTFYKQGANFSVGVCND